MRSDVWRVNHRYYIECVAATYIMHMHDMRSDMRCISHRLHWECGCHVHYAYAWYKMRWALTVQRLYLHVMWIMSVIGPWVCGCHMHDAYTWCEIRCMTCKSQILHVNTGVALSAPTSSYIMHMHNVCGSHTLNVICMMYSTPHASSHIMHVHNACGMYHVACIISHHAYPWCISHHAYPWWQPHTQCNLYDVQYTSCIISHHACA